MNLRQTAAVSAAIVLTASLGGCALNTDETPDSAADTTPDYLAKFDQFFPGVLEQADVGLRIEDLREESCLRPEIKDQQLETRWLGTASGPVPDSGSANAALDRIGSWLDAEGWELEDELFSAPADAGDVRVLVYSQDDVLLTAAYRESEGPYVEVVANTPCRENPPEHQMQRSELDPEYGISSQYYQDGA